MPSNRKQNNEGAPPLISVVCGVYNGAGSDGGKSLEKSLLSVLQQQHDSFEFIVVDDGSTDNTSDIINRLAASYPQLKSIVLPNNQGLTHALKTGCSAARGQYISRHDVGDFSLPDKLSQLQTAFNEPTIVLACCGTRYQGPNQEFIEDVIPTQPLLDTIYNTEPSSIFGASHHGATMFTRAAYETVGGYRMAFPVAQDIDLWIRLAEVGQYRPVADVLYIATIAPNSLSRRHADTQRQARRLAVTAGQLRRDGKSDRPALTIAEQTLRNTQASVSDRDESAGWYFVGCVIRQQNPRAAMRHFWQAIMLYPWNIKAWVRLCTSSLASLIH